MTSYDCLCAGIVVADFLCVPIARLPAAGELVMTDGISIAIGGCASNVAVDLARLGRKTRIAGCVGCDPAGAMVRGELQESGVDVEQLVSLAGVPTSSTLVINVRGEDRRFIHALGATGRFDGATLTPVQLAQARVLYLGGFLMMPRLLGAPAAELFRAARSLGVRTVLDVVIPDPKNGWAELEKVLPWTDVFLPNSDEMRLLTGLEDPRRQAEAIVQAGAGTAVVTCGGDGVFVLDRQRRLKADAFPVEVVDGTGSGDAFVAGYVDGLLDNLPVERCIERGSALGASCVRRPGATTGVFTRQELERFLGEHRLGIGEWGAGGEG